MSKVKDAKQGTANREVGSVKKEADKAIQKELGVLKKHLDKDALTAYVRYLRSPWRIWWSNFLAGLARGLGFVIGATVLVSLFIYLFVQVLVSLPWVGDSFQWVSDNVKLEEIQNLGVSLNRLVEMQEKQVELLEGLSK